jgi:hypothetical protein
MINAKQKNEKINEEERSFTSLGGDFRNPNTRVCGGREEAELGFFIVLLPVL